jgi:hypothetical protein
MNTQIQKGTIFSLSINPEHEILYMVANRMEDICNGGESGWRCIEMNAINEKGIDNISPLDCWRVTDRYIEVQMQRGKIKIVEQISDNK